ncbi:hypothetical protein CDD83_2176 [Cordyceps sp. RAO-2017]|nr:hypothetical protein CDD83_2176 [Cordyceps sp. RAO-2017]
MAALSHPLTTAASEKAPSQARPTRKPSLSTPRSSISDRSTDSSQRQPSASSAGSAAARPQRASHSLLNRAVAALDRTQSAIASLSEPVIRPRQSNSALARLSLAPATPPSSEPSSPDKSKLSAAASPTSTDGGLRHSPHHHHPDQPPHPHAHSPLSPSPPSSDSTATTEATAPPPTTTTTTPTTPTPTTTTTTSDQLSARSGPDTDPPAPVSARLPAAADSKMHQTSSRLLRMTDDDRPFTRDFKDLFATLIVSLLPLSAHRVRLSKVEYTFLSEDAINNLGSLKFSQSNRMPDPKDPSRIVTTTTTTTFSMAKDMARSICQRFVEARFIESADGKYQQVYNMKGSVWQLTPKGVTVLDRFCARNGIQQKQVVELSNMNSAQLVILERDQLSDKLLNDLGTIEVIFRRFVGSDGRNVKATATAADSDSLHDYKDGLTGVKMAAERKVNGRVYRDTFTGKATTDWLMDCSTIVDRRETVEIATLFVEYGLVEAVSPDRAYMAQNTGYNLFQPTKHAVYQLTQRGKDLISGNGSRGRASESEGGAGSQRNGISRDSNTQRLEKILNDPALRLLFRENLRETHCEENLSFYQDVAEFVRGCKAAIRQAQKAPTATSMDSIKEIMAQAYGIYNAFLAPGSPCELNIDHQLRNNLATRMTKAVGQDNSMIETLQEVTALFEDAQNAVFKLMASDSVPKFLRNTKYEHQLRIHDLDINGRMPERSQSRSNRR